MVHAKVLLDQLHAEGVAESAALDVLLAGGVAESAALVSTSDAYALCCPL